MIFEMNFHKNPLKIITTAELWENVAKAVYMRDNQLAIIAQLSYFSGNKVSQPEVGFLCAGTKQTTIPTYVFWKFPRLATFGPEGFFKNLKLATKLQEVL